MEFFVKPIMEQDAKEVASWQYEPPYSLYSISAKDIPVLLNPKNRYFAVRDESDRLAGYCCFGDEAKVPGGVYPMGEPDVLDLGLGMNPELVGKGLGTAFATAIIDFASKEYNPKRLRVSVASFNKRSQKVFLKLGYTETRSFSRVEDGMMFLQLERDANWQA